MSQMVRLAHLDMAIAIHENVSGLKISVHNANRVQVVQTAQQLRRKVLMNMKK